MKTPSSQAAGGALRLIRWLAVGLLGSVAMAFPPAPHHEVFGTVRDPFGNPVAGTGSEVLLEAGGNILGRAVIAPGSQPGVNYRLAIPLDAGTTADLYKPTALRPTVPFRMRVRIGGQTYLPIEMTGASSLVTRPGESSRVDLTLGVDSDGDGIPDAWELALLAALGRAGGVGDVGPDDDSDGDGMSNLEEYLAGTYAFDPADGFDLAIVSTLGGRSILEFTAIRGRSYSIEASGDMKAWSPVEFSLGTDPAGSSGRRVLQATDSRTVRPLVGPFDGEPRFFRLIVH